MHLCAGVKGQEGLGIFAYSLDTSVVHEFSRYRVADWGLGAGEVSVHPAITIVPRAAATLTEKKPAIADRLAIRPRSLAMHSMVRHVLESMP